MELRGLPASSGCGRGVPTGQAVVVVLFFPCEAAEDGVGSGEECGSGEFFVKGDLGFFLLHGGLEDILVVAGEGAVGA